MKQSFRSWITNSGVFAILAIAWCFSLSLYRRIIDGLIEKAFLESGGGRIWEALEKQTEWNAAWVVGYGSILLSLVVLGVLISKKRVEIAWISVIGIHLFAFILTVLLSMNAMMYATWTLWWAK